MNSVHEPGSRTMSKKFDSGKYRVEPGQKQAECTEYTAQDQPARPGRAPAAQPALPRAPRAPAACAPAARAHAAQAPAAPTCAPRAPRACSSPARLQRAHSPSAQRLLRPAATCAPHARPARAQPLAQHLPSAHASCHNTAGVLRYTLPSSNCPSCCVTIQFLCIKTQPLSPLAFLLQYSCLYLCNTNHCIATQKPLYQPSKTTILQYKFFFFTI